MTAGVDNNALEIEQNRSDIESEKRSASDISQTKKQRAFFESLFRPANSDIVSGSHPTVNAAQSVDNTVSELRKSLFSQCVNRLVFGSHQSASFLLLQQGLKLVKVKSMKQIPKRFSITSMHFIKESLFRRLLSQQKQMMLTIIEWVASDHLLPLA